MGSDVYYFQNYMKQPAEIDAQLVGIKDTYETLSDIIGQEQASQYICAYQEHRFQNLKHDFIPKKPFGQYESAEEIITAYESAFQNSIHAYRKFDQKHALQNGDTAALFFQTHTSA